MVKQVKVCQGSVTKIDNEPNVNNGFVLTVQLLGIFRVFFDLYCFVSIIILTCFVKSKSN